MLTIEIKGRIGKTLTRKFIVKMLELLGVKVDSGVDESFQGDYVKFSLNREQIAALGNFVR